MGSHEKQGGVLLQLIDFRQARLIGLPVHALWFLGNQCSGAWFPTKADAQFVGTAQQPVKFPFGLARISQLVTMSTQEICATGMKLDDTPPAPPPADNAGADKPWTRATKSAGRGAVSNGLPDAKFKSLSVWPLRLSAPLYQP